jgi:hypothetical protein
VAVVELTTAVSLPLAPAEHTERLVGRLATALIVPHPGQRIADPERARAYFEAQARRLLARPEGFRPAGRARRARGRATGDGQQHRRQLGRTIAMKQSAEQQRRPDQRARAAGFAPIGEHVERFVTDVLRGAGATPTVLVGPVVWGIKPGRDTRHWYFIVAHADADGAFHVDRLGRTGNWPRTFAARSCWRWCSARRSS